MGLRFILGRAATGKSKQVTTEIKERLLKFPQGSPIYLIVPDQMTFDQEYALFNDTDVKGSIRAEVISFSRLAFRVLQETGGATKQFISSIGIQMMLRKIIEGKKTDWNVFQKAIEKHGFLENLENMITEFKRYQITPDVLKIQIEQINKFTHQEAGEKVLVNKLDDLVYIYEQLAIALESKYIDAEDQLELLIEKIDQTTMFDNAQVYIEGFHGFTPQEFKVLEALMKQSSQMTVVLTVDEEQLTNESELNLFFQTTETYHKLSEIAEENNITIDDTVLKENSNSRMQEKPYFDHLERYFNERPSPPFVGKAPVKIAEAIHPRAEVEGVAQEIIRLVRDEDYRFQDMALFIRETDKYHDLIATIFSDYDVPVFIDEKRTMLNHPLIEFIRSLFDMIESNWRYDAVFRLLKTGFIPITDTDYPLTNDAIDELENYVLEYGIRTKKRWLEDEDWKVQRFRGFDKAVQTDDEINKQNRINRYRKQVVSALQPFDEEIRKANSVLKLSEVTYTTLEKLNVPERLEEAREAFDKEGENEKGREQEQVWSALIQLLDELVEVAGNEKMSLKVYRSVIEAGFDSLEFAHVPPSIDHVIVGTIDRSRMSDIKCTFLLGVNEGIWPMKPPIDGLINEQEREQLSEHGMNLAQSNRRKLLDDWFYIYLSFTSAEDHLWVSYVLSDEEGKSKMPSQLINRTKELFPDSNDVLLLQDPDELVEADRFITTPFKTRSALTAQLARNQRGYPIKPIWSHVLNWYIKHHAKYSTIYNTLQSLYYQNIPVNLTEETVSEIYPKEIEMSVSRLETYYRSSYQYFAKYTLGLKERNINQFAAPDIGLLFHEALKKITEWVQEEGRDFAQISKDEADGYATKAVSNLAAILQHQILDSTNRHKYIQRKLQEVISRAVFVLSEQAKQSEFTPIGLELGFGKEQTLPEIKIPLPNDFEINLRGQIDRVDKALDNEALLLRIIDYKSSARGLDLVEVYYGLALQMLTYLNVILEHSEKWLGVKATPAGILYFHVHNPMISAKGKMLEEDIESELMKEYKMQGLLLAEENVVQLMDTSLETGHSSIIPAGIKKSGGFYSNSKVASADIFNLLQSHIRKLIIDAGLDITSGKVRINPFQYKTQTGNTWDPYLSVSQFDPSLEENKYRHLTHLTDEEVFERIRKEGDFNG